MEEAFGCAVCGADECHEELVEEIFHIGEQYVLVDHIPAAVCDRCGDLTFSAETVEQMRILVHGETKPERSVALSVFKYPAGERAAGHAPA